MKGEITVISILQRKKPRYRDVKSLGPGHKVAELGVEARPAFLHSPLS